MWTHRIGLPSCHAYAIARSTPFCIRSTHFGQVRAQDGCEGFQDPIEYVDGTITTYDFCKMGLSFSNDTEGAWLRSIIKRSADWDSSTDSLPPFAEVDHEESDVCRECRVEVIPKNFSQVAAELTDNVTRAASKASVAK